MKRLEITLDEQKLRIDASLIQYLEYDDFGIQSDNDYILTDSETVKDDVTLSFGVYLRSLRIRKQHSQKSLAEAIGVDTSYISKLENDRVDPPSDVLMSRLSSVLGVSKGYLMARSGKIPPKLQLILRDNPTAMSFFQEAVNANMDERDWKHLLQILRRYIVEKQVATV